MEGVMKGMKGKLVKKLKSVKTIGNLKPDRILRVSAADGIVDTFLAKSSFKVQTQFFRKQVEQQKISASFQEPEIIDVAELMKDLEEEEEEMALEEDNNDDKENRRPENAAVSSNNLKTLSSIQESPLSEMSFRSPDLDSGTLFDPNLLVAFEQAIMEVKAQEIERRSIGIEEQISQEPPLKARKIEEIKDPLSDFEEQCPPGGENSVILYTTGLRGIRKTFEDCTSIRFLLDNFRVLYFERDVSMHSEFKEELWRIFGEKVVPPKMFIKGRYIGGAEEVLGLHEQGKLRPLFDGIPVDQSEGPCQGCAGVRFVMCFCCNGSRKVVRDDDDDGVKQCQECNENGLIICPLCC